MTTECSKVDSRNGPLRRSSSKGLKGLIHIFRSGSTKASGSKLRIPSFRGDRKRLLSSQKHQEPDNLLKEIPSLDFQKLKTDLYIDLAYTNNLLRQRVHRDNLTNLVAQITECLRLIRCRVATAAAYIQTDSLPASSASHGSSENRVILEAVSRFENAYFAFAGWLTELAALKPSPMNVFPAQLGGETTVGLQPSSSHSNSKASILVSAPLARPYSGNEIDSLHNSTVVTPDDVGEVMARGNACFLAIQTAAESVFLSLEVSGCTRPTTPQALSCVNGTQSPLSKAKQTGFLSFHFPRATPSLPGKGPTPNGTPKPPELHRGGGLTLEDRHLLAQLWSLAEPMTDTSPPPKPPLCLGPPQWSSSASMVDLPPSPLYNNVEEGYINVCADVKLNAYLRSLANAVQLTSVIQLNPVQKNNLEESVYSNIDSPGVMEPPLDPTPPDPPPRNNAKQNGCLDLNSLNLPHADDSDASEKENEERKEEFHGGIQIPELTVSLSAVHPHSSTTSLPPPASALPPPYPSPPLPSSVASQRPPHAPATSKCDQNTKKLVEVQNKNSPSSNKPWEPLESVGAFSLDFLSVFY
ncbi:unnamed protein product [Mesocestoides corti]|uniref:Uncharacterized protein n=1 Tax=Mesocestoides corti TaxID=53468 RepID=A0A0R3U1L6_MESCO|nr:unnamed protein product [Mesocestoides corti]